MGLRPVSERKIGVNNEEGVEVYPEGYGYVSKKNSMVYVFSPIYFGNTDMFI